MASSEQVLRVFIEFLPRSLFFDSTARGILKISFFNCLLLGYKITIYFNCDLISSNSCFINSLAFSM